MKQVTQNYRTGVLRVDDFPPPVLRPGGLLVRTAYSLISAGTERTTVETAKSSLVGKAMGRPDLVKQVFDSLKREGLAQTYRKVKARLDQEKAMGYSAAGQVVAVGAGVSEFQVGDRVACAGAGYASHAEIIFVPANLCAHVPASVLLDSACYTTVGAIAMHGVRQSDARLGETVAVIGLGLVGQVTVQLLKASGCQVLGIDIDDAVTALALRSGADAVASSPEAARTECSRLTGGRGADSVIITAGSKSNGPVELAAELGRDRARVVVVGSVGMDIPRASFYGKELELRLSRSYGPGRYDPEYEEKGHDYPIGYVRWTERRNMDAFLALVAAGKINTSLLTTHRFPIDQAEEAYAVISGGKAASAVQTQPGTSLRCGVLLEYPEGVATVPVLHNAGAAAPSRTAARKEGLGVSFIGAGNFARGVLLPAVQAIGNVKLVGIATATGISARNTAQQFGFASAATDYHEVLNDPNTDCVFIATRHDNHAEIAAAALLAGKAVFVEKPLATSIEGLRQVMAAAEASGGLLMAGYNRRFAPIAREIKERFNQRVGAMTVVYRVNAGALPAEHWSHDEMEGGGRVIGEVCHFVDFVQFMTGSRSVRVSAHAVPAVARGGLIDDSVVIALQLADGSVASIIYSAEGDPAVGKERVEILCDSTVAVIDDYKTGSITSGGKTKTLGNKRQDKGHAAEVAAFLSAVRSGSASPIELDSLAVTTLTTLAILDSIRSGTSVEVDLDIVRQ